MSKNKLITKTVSLFLGILITTLTLFSALVIILPLNNVSAEQNGTQDPSGITELDGNNTYVVTAHSFNNVPSNNNNFAQANCDSGDFVITGGYKITRILGSFTNTYEEFDNPVLTNLPSEAILPTGWQVKIGWTALDGVVEWDVYAICFDNPPLKTSIGTSSVLQTQQLENSFTKDSSAQDNLLEKINQGIGDLSAEDRLMKKIVNG